MFKFCLKNKEENIFPIKENRILYALDHKGISLIKFRQEKGVSDALYAVFKTYTRVSIIHLLE